MRKERGGNAEEMGEKIGGNEERYSNWYVGMLDILSYLVNLENKID